MLRSLTSQFNDANNIDVICCSELIWLYVNLIINSRNRKPTLVAINNLPPTTEEVYVFDRAPAFVCLFVCLSVCKIRPTLKRVHGFGWNVSCRQMSANWWTFEPDPDHSPIAGTGLLSPIAYALQCGILLGLLRKNPTYRYWAPVEAATRGFEASKHRCRR